MKKFKIFISKLAALDSSITDSLFMVGGILQTEVFVLRFDTHAFCLFLLLAFRRYTCEVFCVDIEIY